LGESSGRSFQVGDCFGAVSRQLGMGHHPGVVA
jgi:hypothetical protein